MSRSHVIHRRRAFVAAALLALPGVLPGCSAPTAPPAPPSGGQRLVLDAAAFERTVEPVLVRHGCDATGDCHGGGIRGSLQLSPPEAKDPAYDFEQVALQVWPADRERSPILTAPLAGGSPHPIKPFTTTADSGYQAIRAWILSGVMQ